ncbi:MAG: hypothetical protein CME70_04705 [Halobacteriovorax sp.]|nr:hypothetical protein [Halobacteriovorax sp.]|tara:strand:+ start:65860 stop:67077 length:1218 start_codon:yes stop_codon:yes gene_type:complete
MKYLTLLSLIALLVSCGNRKTSPVAGEPHQNEIEKNLGFFDSNKKLVSAKPGSLYYSSIRNCALQKLGKDCTPEKVPLLGTKGREINTKFVLENTIVSHDFLAKNFEEYLNNIDNKFLFALFASVSGIVITDEISSSFYYTPTGMIYLNASYLWKTQVEFKKLKFKKDGRYSRDERKKVFTDWDFVKDNKTIYSSYYVKERSIAVIKPVLTRLLFHELTHANDVYPIDEFDTLDKTKSYYELRSSRYENKEMVSRKIVYPETKKAWEYAIFLIYGELENPNSHDFTIEDFISDFVPNIGIIFYSYITNREHLAMMMENYFMLFTEHYETCTYGKFRKDNESDSSIFWFQKNRILQTNILLEARNAIELMLPADMAQELNSLNTVFSLETHEDIAPDSNQKFCKNY